MKAPAIDQVKAQLDALRGAGALATERPVLAQSQELLARAEAAAERAPAVHDALVSRAAASVAAAARRYARALEKAASKRAESRARQAPARAIVMARMARARRAADRRGIRLPSHLRRREPSLETAEISSRHLFRETLHFARASLALTRGHRIVATEIGHYNPQGLSLQVLQLLERLSPRYLRAYLAALEDVATLDALPANRTAARRKRA